MRDLDDVKTNEIRGLKYENKWDYENGFYWFSSPTRINKLLAHYELYKTISNLPGDIFELGVYKGASLVRFASYRSVMENDYSRKIIAFDAFGEFPKAQVSLPNDIGFITDFEREGGDGLSVEEIQYLIKRKGFVNLNLIKGNVFSTLPEYLLKNPACKIALLHLDMDVKEPTEFSLNLLWDRIVSGGVVIFDDYTAVEGATVAVDEFVRKNNLKLEKTNHYSVPSYIRK